MTEQRMRRPRPFVYLWVVVALVLLVSFGTPGRVSATGGGDRAVTLKATMAALVQTLTYQNVRSGVSPNNGMIRGVLSPTGGASATIERDDGSRAALDVFLTSSSTYEFLVEGSIGSMTFAGGGAVCISDGSSGEQIVVTTSSFGNTWYGNLGITTIGFMTIGQNPLKDVLEDADGLTATNQWGHTKATLAGRGTIDTDRTGRINVDYVFRNPVCPPLTPGDFREIIFHGQVEPPDPFEPKPDPFSVTIREVII